MLAEMHRTWEGVAETRWPWLRRAGKTADVIGNLYDRVWEGIEERPDVTPMIQNVGSSLVGNVAAIERNEAVSAKRTLIQGDATLRNTRTSPDGVIAFIDWEDVRSANGTVDLSWLLVSSVEPEAWHNVITAYSPDHDDFRASMPQAITQGILCFGDSHPESAEATGWIARLESAASHLG